MTCSGLFPMLGCVCVGLRPRVCATSSNEIDTKEMGLETYRRRGSNNQFNFRPPGFSAESRVRPEAQSIPF